MRDELKLLIFSAVLLAIFFATSVFVPLPWPVLIVLSFFFTTFTFIFNARLKRALNDENKNKFVHVFLGFTGMKMLGSLVLLALILALVKHDRLNTGICVLVYYLLYTIFEVVLWTRKLKQKA
jgi:uncharacterized membrane protein